MTWSVDRILREQTTLNGPRKALSIYETPSYVRFVLCGLSPACPRTDRFGPP